MKILQLCKKFPYPIKDGETIAINALSRSFHKVGCEVSLLAMNTDKHFFNLDKLPNSFNHYQNIEVVKIDTTIKPWSAFLNLFSSSSYHIQRFISKDFSKKLQYLLRNNHYDIVQLETLYLAPYVPIIRQYSNAKIVMRAHNVEHEIWERIAQNTNLLPKKWYLNYLSTKLKHFEIGQLNTYDILAAITDKDLSYFQAKGFSNTGVVVPIGMDSQQYIANFKTYIQPPSFSFIGSLDWIPNQEGLDWFLDKVWKKVNSTSFHIAGRNTPSKYLNLQMRGVRVHGEVPNAKAFINQHSIMIVPLLSGSGMRAKILEGMALGRVVITTNLGLEGISAHHQKELLIANTPTEFLNQINWCLANPKELVTIGKSAKRFIEQYYDQDSIATKLVQLYTKEEPIEAITNKA